jgi:hydroxymethylbilane synthase
MRSAIRIGTRASRLAIAQAEIVAAGLRGLGHECELVPISTRGDRVRGPLGQVGERGLFVGEIERALEQGKVDLAVHSLKDLPEPVLPHFSLGAIARRADARDALVSAQGLRLEQLPRGARVGTSSRRRAAQLMRARPDLVVLDARGNVDTRLRKLEAGEWDALVTAAAALDRLGLSARITQRLPLNRFVPAPGQGALAVEVMADNKSMRRIAALLDHEPSRAAVEAERAVMRELEAGCHLPLGAFGRVDGGRLLLVAEVLSPDGAERTRVRHQGSARNPGAVGRQAARVLMERGVVTRC